MTEYIYILSNPSMSGLLKIGKTTKSPNKRMVELHSTGVPTPFVLDFAAEVNDCTHSEKVIHQVLANYRVSKNREFFRIEIKQALELVLEVIGEYEIHYLSHNFNIEKIRKKINEKTRIKEEREKIEYEKYLEKSMALKSIKQNELAELNLKIVEIKKKLDMLGNCPKKYEPDFIELIVLLPSESFVLFYILFLSPFLVFPFVGDNFFLAGVGIAWLAVSLFHEKNIKKMHNDYCIKVEPFEKYQEMINSYTNKTAALKKEIEAISRL